MTQKRNIQPYQNQRKKKKKVKKQVTRTLISSRSRFPAPEWGKKVNHASSERQDCYAIS